MNNWCAYWYLLKTCCIRRYQDLVNLMFVNRQNRLILWMFVINFILLKYSSILVFQKRLSYSFLSLLLSCLCLKLISWPFPSTRLSKRHVGFTRLSVILSDKTDKFCDYICVCHTDVWTSAARCIWTQNLVLSPEIVRKTLDLRETDDARWPRSQIALPETCRLIASSSLGPGSFRGGPAETPVPSKTNHGPWLRGGGTRVLDISGGFVEFVLLQTYNIRYHVRPAAVQRIHRCILYHYKI